MKLRFCNRDRDAMTLIEVIVVLVVVLIMAAMLLPALGKAKRHASRIYCANNLKQDGLAFRIWAGDHGNVYPMGIPLANGGSQELVQTGDVVHTYQIVAEQLSTPKVLLCTGVGSLEGDTKRTFATNFASLSNSNISYFVSADAVNIANPNLILFGDSNFEIGGVPVKPGLRAFWTNDPAIWTTNWHGNILGNLSYADGSVQSATIVKWKYVLNFQLTGLATNRFAIP